MAKRKKHHEEEEGNGEAWLLPYSDLMTLLLAVFIVLFAVSNLDQSKAQKLAESFSQNMMAKGAGVFSGESDVVKVFPDGGNTATENNQNTGENPETTNISQDGTSTTTNKEATDEEIKEFLGADEMKSLEELKSEIDAQIQSDNLTDSVTTGIDMRGLVISLNNAVLFDSGKTDIKEKNEGPLLQIASMINKTDNYIRIEGHTDNKPIKSDIFASNWELSTARASTVVRLFVNKGNVDPERLSAVGYGEYRPLVSNATAEGRAKNRRIDIIIMSNKYNNMEQ